MHKLLLTITLAIFSLTATLFATEFNELSFYEGKVEKAYNQTDLPMLPGKWKIFDMEKSGSVPSGNFYVYATLAPEALGVNDNLFFFDSINYAVLGSRSEETEYRKTFYGCESDFYEAAIVNTININSRGSGNFEETCAGYADANNGNHSFYFVDCADICVEVNFALYNEAYYIDESNFVEIAELVFDEIRSTVSGKNQNPSLEFLNSYKK